MLQAGQVLDGQAHALQGVEELFGMRGERRRAASHSNVPRYNRTFVFWLGQDDLALAHDLQVRGDVRPHSGFISTPHKKGLVVRKCLEIQRLASGAEERYRKRRGERGKVTRKQELQTKGEKLRESPMLLLQRLMVFAARDMGCVWVLREVRL